MATDPIFAATANVGAGIVPATADTSNTAPSNTTTVFTAGASGSKVDEIRITQIASTSGAGIVNLFAHDGSTYHLYDYYIFATFTVSTTAQTAVYQFFPENLVLKTGWTLRATVTTSAGQSAFKVLVFGGDF